MFSKEELKNYNIQFWAEFKQRMGQHRGASGKKVNWLQYRTHLQNVYVRLETINKACKFCFDIQFKDDSIREIVWEQMGELKKLLTSEMGSEGNWIEDYSSGTIKSMCRIEWTLENTNYLTASNKEKIFDFFEDKLLRFDRFYDSYGEILYHLVK
jgi:hypothetical protein